MGIATLVTPTAADTRRFDVGLTAQDMKEVSVHLVLDRQQRLTAAYQSCCAPGAVRVNSTKGVRHHCFFLDMKNAIDATIPMRDAIFSVEIRADGDLGNGTAIDCFDSAPQYKLGIVPTNALLRSETYELGFEQYWSESSRTTDRPGALDKLRYFRRAIVDGFERYKVPVRN